MATTPASEVTEAQLATTAYQLALSRIGVQTTAQALALWDHMPPNAPARVAQTWLNAVTKLISIQRKRAKDLANSFYVYIRAVQTGHTVAQPGGSGTTTLEELRQDFYSKAGVKIPKALAEAPDAEVTPIIVDEIRDLSKEEAKLEELVVQEIRNNLTNTGIQVQAKLVDQIDKSLPSEATDRFKQEAHGRAGSRQAAAASRYAMNGGRAQAWLLQQADAGAIGWIRISTTGTPCGWCAMLISRGPVYKSERGATVDYETGDQYHDNCHCIAVPVFDRDYYKESPLFEQNREYATLWPKVTKGLGGKDALAAWRKHFRTKQTGAVQEAA